MSSNDTDTQTQEDQAVSPWEILASAPMIYEGGKTDHERAQTILEESFKGLAKWAQYATTEKTLAGTGTRSLSAFVAFIITSEATSPGLMVKMMTTEESVEINKVRNTVNTILKRISANVATQDITKANSPHIALMKSLQQLSRKQEGQ